MEQGTYLGHKKMERRGTLFGHEKMEHQTLGCSNIRLQAVLVGDFSTLVPLRKKVEQKKTEKHPCL